MAGRCPTTKHHECRLMYDKHRSMEEALHFVQGKAWSYELENYRWEIL